MLANLLMSLICEKHYNNFKKSQKYLNVATFKIKKPCNKQEQLFKSFSYFLFKFCFYSFCLKFIDKIDDHKWKCFHKATVLTKLSKFEKSNEIIQEINQDSDFFTDIYFLQAKNNFFLLDNFEAEESFFSFLKINENKVKNNKLLLLALIYIQRKNYKYSEKILSQLTVHRQNSSIIWYFYGISLSENESYTNAEEAFIKSLSIDPHYYENLFHLCLLKMKSKVSCKFQTSFDKKLISDFFYCIENLNISNCEILQKLSDYFKEVELIDLSSQCLLKLIEIYINYYQQEENKLINIFEIEKKLLSKI